MTKVITYGTYDLLHYGHIRLLERAKALGDYLIVGVTADDFDKIRGKINVQQSLMERIEAVRATGLADEIIVEEYEGQKIDDIRKYDVDIFTVGSDWVGKFDYLNKYCKVVYLDRTEGISSSEIRSEKREIKLGLIGDSSYLNKLYDESKCVNGIHVNALYSTNPELLKSDLVKLNMDFEDLLEKSDAVFIKSFPENHYAHIKFALKNGKHVLCESPLSLSNNELRELFTLAEDKHLILMESIKTAYSTAFSRLVLLVKSGAIGEVVSVETTCTCQNKTVSNWPGMYEWGPTALLPIFEILGTEFSKRIITKKDSSGKDIFSQIDLIFKNAVALAKVGDGIKSEGELIISGTKGYAYVPAPWWKTEYFELRFEDPNQNKRYFYQLEGEGIRYMLVVFIRAIENGKIVPDISFSTTNAITQIMGDYNNGISVII